MPHLSGWRLNVSHVRNTMSGTGTHCRTIAPSRFLNLSARVSSLDFISDSVHLRFVQVFF